MSIGSMAENSQGTRQEIQSGKTAKPIKTDQSVSLFVITCLLALFVLKQENDTHPSASLRFHADRTYPVQV